GGPGTGKTTTVARVAALLCEQAAARGARPPLMALVAPTGKAAARLAEAVGEQTARMEISDGVRQTLLGQGSSTLHRLLGRRRGSHSRFRHDRLQRLPHDVVILDETSMVALSLMARLIEALRPQARLVLVGDPGQLASVEAGAVLGDIVGPAADGLLMSAAARERLAVLTEAPLKAPLEGATPAGRAPIADGIVVLDRGHRFGGAIAALAEAVRRGDGERTVALLRERTEEVQWIQEDPGMADSAAALSAVRAPALAAATAVTVAARAGLAREALRALGAFRILCAHRRGPHGVSSWTARVESWLTDAVPGVDPGDPWYPGRPLLVGENDPELGLFNGDTGVIVRRGPDSLAAAFVRSDGIVEIHPARLSAIDTVYAMTIHKSQGSQFEQVAVLLPPPDSRILTRELLLTALTRARHRLIVLGSEESVRQAVARPVARASGLRRRLWQEFHPTAPVSPAGAAGIQSPP
ncbi:MAG: exodeoxyribonuclease V subunit alpha, partial [Actinomycetota bacterium]|nr:exodeoxyribonuclease V subunit alpha [Actinomycetota bacterium]